MPPSLAGVALLAMLCCPPLASPQQRLPDSVSPSRLKSLSLEQLGQVEVTTVSKQPEEVWRTPAAVVVVTHEDIQRSGATTIPEILRLVPGAIVQRSQSGAWAVGIRGFTSGFSKDLLVLIDGRSVYTPLFEGVYWDVQDLVLDDIDRVEVIRGPGGTIWGPNAVNGVINIITRRAADTQGAFVHLAGGGPVDRFIGELRLGLHPLPRMDLRLFAKGFNRGPEQNPGGVPYDQWHQARGGFRLDWNPGRYDRWTASGMVYGGRTGDQNTIGEFFPPSQLVVNGQQIVSGGDVVVRWDHTLPGASDFYFQAYFDRTNRATSQFTETRNTFDLDFIDHLASLPRQNLIMGAGLRESPSHLVQTQATVNFTPSKINNYIYSLFAQDTFGLIPGSLLLTVGSKFIDNNYSGWGVQPSAQLLWHPRSGTTLWGSAARALRAPGRLDRDLSLIGNVAPDGPRGPIFLQVEGNPDFVPEVLIGWNAGVRQLLWNKLYLDLAAFHNQYDKVESYGGPAPLFTFPTNPYPYEQINIQFANGLRGISSGFEIAPEWKPLLSLALRGSYSYLHVDLHSRPGYSQETYASSIEGSSPHRQAFVQAVWAVGAGFEITPTYRFVSALPAVPVRSYQTADARIAWHGERHFTVSVNGRNLLQPQHQETKGDNGNTVGIKREIFAGLTLHW